MTKEPWLEALSSDDWISQSPSQSPRTSLPPSSVPNSARKCIGCTHQSRIPRLTESPSPVVKGKSFQKHSKAKSLGSVTPSPRPSPRLKKPVKGVSDESPRPSSSASSRKKGPSSPSKQTPARHRLHARSISEVSNKTVQNGTIQVRPEKSNKSETPEWKRRLIRGEMSTDEPCDLFAPLGIESMFKHAPSKEPDKVIPRRFASPTGPSVHESSGEASQAPEIVEDSIEDSMKRNSSCEKPSVTPNSTSNERQTKVETSMNELHDSDATTHDATEDANSSCHLGTTSGPDDVRDEGITPIFLSRNNTANFRSASAVIKSALQKLTGETEDRSNSGFGNVILEDGDFERASNDVHSFLTQGEEMQPGDILDVTSQSLPNDLSMGTQEIISNSPFVNFRRGGYSEDGSFRRRRLSPSSAPSHTQFSSLVSSSKIRSSPPPNDIANPFQDKQSISSPNIQNADVADIPIKDTSSLLRARNMRSTGSPLKLFGDHDTFTNNKLLRRMSQFEGHIDGTLETDEPPSPSLGIRRRRANRSLPNLRQETATTALHEVQGSQKWRDAADPGIGRFGNGQLDAYGFVSKLPHSASIPQRTFSQRSQDTLRKARSLDSIPERRAFSNGRAASPFRNHQNAQPDSGTPELPHQGPEVRPSLNTPGRVSQPKRRRTMQAEGQNLGATGHGPSFADGGSMKEAAVAQLKLKDPVNDISSAVSDKIQRPRSPTPNGSRAPPSKILSHDSPSNNRTGMAQLDSAFGKATKTNAGTASSMQESRKASMSTQDYIDEALKVMNMIRAKGKPNSGLASVNESEMEDGSNNNESYADESSAENFSRPPSREGVDMRKLRTERKLHPRVVSHLKKFADKEDMDLGMGVSVMSLHLKGTCDRESPVQATQDAVESSPRNIRIRENPFMHRKRKHSEESDKQALNENDLARGTSIASGILTEQSIPTTSSTGSHTKGIIASEMVSHLIPEQVNGMIYDASTHTWVRKKLEQASQKLRGDESEDDPFRGISDLSVDESQEMIKFQQFASPLRKTHLADHTQASQESKANSIENLAAAETNDIRPTTRDGPIPNPDSSSVQSKVTRFTYSGPRPETRATSWGTEELGGNTAQPSRHDEKRQTNNVESGIKLQDSHIQQSPESSKQPRVVTISFSSPLVSHIAYPEEEDSPNSKEIDIAELRAPSEKSERIHHVYGKLKDKITAPAPVRRRSLDGRSFVGRPISRIDELNEDSPKELSLVPRETGTIMSTPASVRLERSLVRSSPPAPNTSYSFHLSPLADFTVHQIDDPVQLEVSYVAQRTHPASLRQVHGTFALAAEDLVKHITDVEPYEPYWEDMKRLDIRGKGLITLHRLNEFCSRLEELDASDNQIGQLSGAPRTVRNLRIQHNCLSNLTAWGHLVNLQYLDVSGNDIETLDGFSSLIHLRELRANHNRIRSVDGVLDMNGLLRLELRGNVLTEVDFEGSELTRLTEVDLRNNQLLAVKNVGSLPVLEHLDLCGNRLSKFGPTRQLRSLHSLKVSDNKMQSLDVSFLHGIKLLYADRNCLSTIIGLEKCCNLEVLSLREQLVDSTDTFKMDLDLSSLVDIRKLFLSSNRLSERTLAPPTPVPSLQLLDIASCGVTELSSNFGSKFPNLRVINLNFNALTDVRGLSGIHGLGRLTLVGNRITRLRKLCQTIRQLNREGPGSIGSLKTVDLRGNPLTVRFYPPSVLGNGRIEGTIKGRASAQAENTVRRGLTTADSRALTKAEGASDMVESEKSDNRELEIDDPYTIPPADIDADLKYRSHLDQSTKTRRLVMELLVFASTNGAIHTLNGLDLRKVLESEGTQMDHVWMQLEAVGVLKKKGANVST